MTTALAERPTAPAPVAAPAPAPAAAAGPALPAPAVAEPESELEIDRDGLEVYCSEADGWSRTRHFFCESCGATDHDLR